MPQPTLSKVAQRLYDALAPQAYDDPNQDWALALFCAGIAKMFDQVSSYIETRTNGVDGWGPMLDIEQVPDEAIEWLGQFYGVVIPIGTDPTTARNMVRNAAGLRRGTPASLIAAAKLHLTGSKTVLISERYGGNAYYLKVQTYDTETPASGITLNDILTQKPAGLILDYSLAAAPPDYNCNPAFFNHYSDLPLAYYTYDDMRSRCARGGLLASYDTIRTRYGTYVDVENADASYLLLRQENL